jgi:hypothetical protein
MLKMFKSINIKIFLKLFVTLVIVYIISYLFAFSRAEGAEGIFILAMSVPAMILSFPFFWLCATVEVLRHPISFLFAIGLDIILYAFIIERVISNLLVGKKNKEL